MVGAGGAGTEDSGILKEKDGDRMMTKSVKTLDACLKGFGNGSVGALALGLGPGLGLGLRSDC